MLPVLTAASRRLGTSVLLCTLRGIEQISRIIVQRANGTVDALVLDEAVGLSYIADNPDLKLKPRLTANITIYTEEKHDVLSVPAKALRFMPVGELMKKGTVINDCDSRWKVWTREGNVFTAHPVTIGLSDGINTEITGGIPEGTVVLTEAKFVNDKAMPGKKGASFLPGPPR